VAGGGAVGGDTSGGSGGDGRGGTAAATGGTDIGGNAAVGGGTAGSGETGGVGGASAGAMGEAGAAAEAGAGGMAGDGGTCVPEVCDGASNDCDDEIDEDGVCPPGCSARVHGAHVYVLCLSPTVIAGSTYNVAYTRCAGLAEELGLEQSFDLVSIEDDEENTFLKGWIAEKPTIADAAVWMGANDLGLENTWVWGRGANAVQFFSGYTAGGGLPFMGRYNDFGEGKPNSSNGTDEDCGAFDSEVAWQWNDRECTNKQIGFICEQQP
jgi:hypothetical protein